MSLIFRNAIAGLIILTFLSGCATVKPDLPRRPPARSPQAKPQPKPHPKPQLPQPAIKKRVPEKPPPRATPSPRTVALLSLIDQGRAYLKQNRPDAAIRLLERAVSINPQRGESYYYLAQAWLMKENFSQALEYNRLAGTYLGRDPQWTRRINIQRQKIKGK